MALLDTVFQASALLASAVIGASAAHKWQQRSSRDARLFDASKETYGQMSTAATEIISLIGRRIYASQRLCLADRSSDNYRKYIEDFRTAVEDWNIHHLSMDLNVRSLFKGAYLSDFELLQNRLAAVTSRVDSYAQSGNGDPVRIKETFSRLRYDYFLFAQSMQKEARLMYRQMHFGIRLDYAAWDIEKFSTRQLFVSLLSGRVEEISIIRSPSDLGQPLVASEARFGVYEH